VLHQKRHDRQGVVCRHVVLVKNPWAFLPHFTSSSHPFTKVCQNLLVVDLVNGMTFRHTLRVNNPSDVEKKIIIDLNFDLLCRAFFCLGELGLFQCMDWRLLSGSHWKKPWFITSLGLFNVLKNVSTNVHSNFLLFRSEESWDHLRTHYFHVEIVL